MGVVQGQKLANRLYANSAKVINPKYTIVSGKWLNFKDEDITLSQEGTKVKFKIKTKHVPDNTSITGNVLRSIDYSFDKKISAFSGTIKNNIAIIEFQLDDKIVTNNVSELYFEVELDYEGEMISEELPKSERDYLQVVKRGVLVSVFVEMPEDLTEEQIKASDDVLEKIGERANDMGLSGHVAIAINEEYYDYGPSTGAYYYSPGQPWWDAFAHSETRGSVDVSNVGGKDYSLVRQFIKNIARNGATIHEIKFLVTINQAKILKNWWDNKYKKLGTYSVVGAVGDHCTNTVMESLNEAGIIGTGFLGSLDYFTEIAEPSEFYTNYMKKVTHSAGFLINNKIPHNLNEISINSISAFGKKAEVMTL